LFSVVNFLKCVVTEVLLSVVATKTIISQGGVATHFKCDGIFIYIIINFLLILTVELVWQLVNIW